MRSELINEIFSVESEAEKIVSEAQLKGRELVSEAQKRGEEALREAVEKARTDRDTAIRHAQQKAEERIAAQREALELSDVDNKDLITRADTIADSMVKVLCRTTLGDPVS